MQVFASLELSQSHDRSLPPSHNRPSMMVNYVYSHPWIAIQHQVGVQSGLMMHAVTDTCAHAGTV
jgi:hypothetical protein